MTIEDLYEVLNDYWDHPVGLSWGEVLVRNSRYEFPSELKAHREQQIAECKGQGRLHPDDRPAARIAGFQNGKVPRFVVELASYYDQVGTNLSLDVQLNPRLWAAAGERECRTIREWDAAQAGLPPGGRPSLEKSRLANTLGVAVAIGVTRADGSRALLRRKRSERTMVYRNEWGVPWSFAFSPRTETGTFDLFDYLSLDIGHELGHELPPLHPNQLSTLKPIAFARDLRRGGKPQLFLFAELSGITFEGLFRELQKRPDITGEFAPDLEFEDGQLGVTRSDELVAANTLMQRWIDGAAPRGQPERYVFKRDSNTWTMVFGHDTRSGVKDLKGFHAIRHALRGETNPATIMRLTKLSASLEAQRKGVASAIEFLRSDAFPALGSHLKERLVFGKTKVAYSGGLSWDAE